MELKTMTIEELEARKAEIAAEADSLEDMEAVNARNEELNAINAELEERANLEAKKAELRKAVAEGAGEVIKPVIEERKDTVMYTVESAEYRTAYLKNLMGRELDVEERSAVTATAAIPTVTLNKIVAAFEKAPLLQKVDITNFPSYVRIPVESSAAAASWTTSSSDSADTLTYIELTPYQLIKTVEVPADVNNMSIDAFESYLVSRLANKIEVALQAAIISGNGSSKPTGIAQTISTATGTFHRTLTTADLLKIMGSLEDPFQANACWIMPSKVFYEDCMALANCIDFAAMNAGFGPKLLGKDVVLTAEATISSTDNIFYGDPKHYHLNFGENIKVDKDASVAFRSNNVVYRAVCLADGRLDLSNAFVRYTRGTN